jgi:hypothetical protein
MTTSRSSSESLDDRRSLKNLLIFSDLKDIRGAPLLPSFYYCMRLAYSGLVGSCTRELGVLHCAWRRAGYLTGSG